LSEIRAIAFPRKRIPLQQSIASSDCSSDGYINETQFIEAFYRAGVNIRRDSLEFLFDVMAERFTSAKVKLSDDPPQEEKFLNIFFFSNRLFTKRESEEVDEVDVTLQLLKSALIYKGLDFSAIFSEKSDEEPKKRLQRKGIKGAPKEKKQVVQKDTNIDLMSYHTRFAQQLIKDEFCNRLMKLNAQNVNEQKIRRLANYLSQNEKNKSVVYLNSWLHHIRRVQGAFHIKANEDVLPSICSLILQNETYFRSLCDTAGLKNKVEEQKNIDIADLKSVLKKYNINYEY
jgi:hypothetical protein